MEPGGWASRPWDSELVERWRRLVWDLWVQHSELWASPLMLKMWALMEAEEPEEEVEHSDVEEGALDHS